MTYKGVVLGWMYGRADKWRAYLRTGPLTPGTPLGQFTRLEAIQRILSASGESE
ncbi:hypothetical protein [Actinoplanes siamensis]|uniref:hypothetical protein n=1 Tax=Actinoplanes siamensis TaxID=1223317 RepID=UPI0019433E26|nr:hypothetical protein [Actinoplanes siamensis]